VYVYVAENPGRAIVWLNTFPLLLIVRVRYSKPSVSRSPACNSAGAAYHLDTSQTLGLLRLSHNYPGCHETRRHLRRLRQRAHDLVRADLYPIHRLAEALRERHKFSGGEAEYILTAARAELAQSSAGSFQEPVSSR
jgi:hypothetical protein